MVVEWSSRLLKSTPEQPSIVVRTSLRRRVLWQIAAGVSLVLLIFSVITVWSHYRVSEELISQRGERMVDFLAAGLERPLWDLDRLGVEGILQIAAHDPDFLYVEVTDEVGNRFSIGDSERATPDQELTLRRVVSHRQEDRSHEIGTVSLILATAPLQQFLIRRVIDESILVIVLLLANLGVVFAGLEQLLRPFRRLIGYLQRFSQGDYEQPFFELSRQDEIGEMAQALEMMRLHSMERKQMRESLARVNNDLEQRVGQRTIELAREIEVRRLAEERALAADQAKSNFLASMSHEIRTPLNGIIGLTQLSLKGEGLPPHQRNYLEKILLSGEVLLEIINEILDFSKIESGELQLESVSFDPLKLLEDISGVVSYRALERGLDLLFDIDPAVPQRLVGDPIRIQQVLLNLVSNAIKFTESGEVVVRLEPLERGKEQSRLRWRVIDSGIGISPQQAERLFDTFTQAESSTTRKYGGTGLGLAVSRRLVTLMEGTIDFDSEPGRGSTFYFELDLGRAEEFSIPTVPHCLLGKTLVIDHHRRGGELLANMITRRSGEAEWVGTLDEALEQLEQADHSDVPYRMVLLDWYLPGISGEEALARIGSTALSIAPKVVVLSPHAADMVLVNRYPDTVTGQLIKPILPQQFYRMSGQLDQQGGGNLGTATDLDAVTPPNFSHARILVVEDNPVNQLVIQEVLRGMGVEPVVVADGRAGVNQALNSQFDLVLMDIQMPGISGYEATREIRQRLSTEALPVVALSANAMDEYRRLAAEAGMDDFLSKPIDLEQLVAVMRNYLQDSPAEERRLTGESREEVDLESVTKSTSAPRMIEECAQMDVESGEKEGATAEILLDVTEGVERLLGNREIYLSVLESFAEDNRDFIAQLQHQLEHVGLDSARRTLHSLKGSAANVSAKPLAARCKEIEAEVIAGNRPGEGDLQRLGQALEQLLREIDRLLGQERKVSLAPISLRPLHAQERDQLQRLQSRLMENDMAAQELYEACRVWLPEVASDERMEWMRGRMGRLDYAAVADLIAEWLQQEEG